MLLLSQTQYIFEWHLCLLKKIEILKVHTSNLSVLYCTVLYWDNKMSWPILKSQYDSQHYLHPLKDVCYTVLYIWMNCIKLLILNNKQHIVNNCQHISENYLDLTVCGILKLIILQFYCRTWNIKTKYKCG